MFEILPVNDEDNILAFKASGKLTDADYKQFLPVLETMIREKGRISLYIEVQDLKGWEAKAAWDDLRFDLQHDNDFKRIAIISDKSLVHATTVFINLFSHIDMRFFEESESEAAWDWLREIPQASKSSAPVQPYKNILLATDFSAYSDIAARRALQLTKQYNAQLHVLHAVENLVYYNEAYDSVIAEIPLPPPEDDLLLNMATAHMQKYCEQNSMAE